MICCFVLIIHAFAYADSLDAFERLGVPDSSADERLNGALRRNPNRRAGPVSAAAAAAGDDDSDDEEQQPAPVSVCVNSFLWVCVFSFCFLLCVKPFA